MQTQTVGQQGNKQAQQTIAFPGGDFLVSLGLSTEQRLFGGIAVQARGQISESVVITGGDVSAHFASRVPYIGIVVTIPSANSIEEVTAAIARQLVSATGKHDGVNEKQIYRIALEYTAQAAALPLTHVEPWEQYIPNAVRLRQLFSQVNAAAQLATEQAFGKKDVQKAVKMGTEARDAWGKIQVLLQQSPHLATFRAQIGLPLMFADTAGWLQLAGMKAADRQATIAQLKQMIEQTGSPIITETRVQQAADRVQGLQRLQHGNRNGIAPDAFIHATAQGRMADKAEPNGGKTTKLAGVELSALGQYFRGMRGTADVTAEAQKDGTVQVTATVTEDGQPSSVFVPTTWRNQSQQHAQA